MSGYEALRKALPNMYQVNLDYGLQAVGEQEQIKDPWFALTPDSYAFLRALTSDRLQRALASSNYAIEEKSIRDSFAKIHNAAFKQFGGSALQASLMFPSGIKYPASANNRQAIPEIPLEMISNFTNSVDYVEVIIDGKSFNIVEKISGRFSNEIPASSWFALYNTCRILEGTLKTISFKESK